MTISLKPMWKLLIGRYMAKADFGLVTGLSAPTIGKLGKDHNVNVPADVFARIREALDCSLEQIALSMAAKEYGGSDEWDSQRPNRAV